jgi:hypothetical protein
MGDEMAMKQRGGTNSKIVVERMLNVFDSHFPTPAVKAMSRICACKTERNLQIFGWCLQFKQSCLWATLSFCLQKQGMENNAMRRVFSENASKELSVIIRLECEEVSLQIEFTTLPPKNDNLFVKLERKGNWRKGSCGHRLIMHSITRREKNGEGGGGVVK